MTEVSVVPLERLRRDPLWLALRPCVLNDGAHAMAAVVVSKVAHHPDAGVPHLDDGGDALGRTQPQDRHVHRCRKEIAVHGDDRERVTGQCEAASFAGAAVEHMEEHTLPFFYADRFAVAEHPAVDGEGIVPDFVTVLVAFGERGAHGALTLIFQRCDRGGGGY